MKLEKTTPYQDTCYKSPLNIVSSTWLRDVTDSHTKTGAPAQTMAAAIKIASVAAGSLKVGPVKITTVVCLSTLSDLGAIPALQELLNCDGISPNIYIVLPTAEAAQFAKNQLPGLLGFATITDPKNLESLLPEQEPFITLSRGSRLKNDFRDRLESFLTEKPETQSAPLSQPLPIVAAKSVEDLRSEFAQMSSHEPIAPLDEPGSDHFFDDQSFYPVSTLSLNPRTSAKPPVSWYFSSGRLNLIPQVSTVKHVSIDVAGMDENHIIYAKAHNHHEKNVPVVASLPLELINRHPIKGNISVQTTRRQTVIPFTGTFPPHEILPEMVTCFLNRGGAGNPMIRAFAEGIGARLRYAEDETCPRPGVPLVWGVLRGSDKVISYAEGAGQYWFYVDHAYMARGHLKNYRVTRNSYDAGSIRQCSDDRLAKLGIEVKPWSKGGEIILVCPPTEYFMAAHNCESWLYDTLENLKKLTDRPVVVRDKPQPGEAIEPLESVLQRTHALVTHSSNVAIEAAILGTPVFVSPLSAAAPIGKTDLKDIDHPIYPERHKWLSHLAYSQFTFDEIRYGDAWRILLENETRPLARE